jgi:hypothetical protein
VLTANATPTAGTGADPGPAASGGGSPADMAAAVCAPAVCAPATVCRYGRRDQVVLADVSCLRNSISRSRAVRVILVRDPPGESQPAIT